MRIKIEYPAMLQVDAPPPRSEMDVEDGITMSALLDLIKVSKPHQKTMVLFVNGERVLPARTLQAGDHVYLAIPFGGG